MACPRCPETLPDVEADAVRVAGMGFKPHFADPFGHHVTGMCLDQSGSGTLPLRCCRDPQIGDLADARSPRTIADHCSIHFGNIGIAPVFAGFSVEHRDDSIPITWMLRCAGFKLIEIAPI